jgi:hypothetical protein
MSRLAFAAVILLLAATLASTRPGSDSKVVHAAVVSNYAFTGAPVNYLVPAGVTRLMVTATGALGGTSLPCNSAGGAGGLIRAIVTVTPGATLQVLVGGNGTATTAGFNGGGPGGNSSAANRGAGGGGESDVRIAPFGLADRIVVAGGGGGAGGCSVASGGAGGSGGNPGTAGATGTGAIPGAGGGGATTAAGGSGPPPFGTGTPGQGGTGGTSAGAPPFGDGGGGGGGYFGGGGGFASPGDTGNAGGGGGGGGSNFAVPSAAIITNGLSGVPSGVSITTLDPPTITKSFNPPTVAVNGLTNLTLTIRNPNIPGLFHVLTGISVTDNLPAGLVIETGAVSGVPLCGGTITATAGTSTISLANGTLMGLEFCQITVQVRVTTPGDKLNTTGAVSAAESGPGGTAVATLGVASTVPGIAKSFDPPAVLLGTTSVMTITLNNPNIIGMTGVAFTDNFAALGLVITSAAPSGTPLCAGTITANPGTSLVSLTGGTLAANSNCQIVVTVRANTLGNQLNTTSTLTSNEFGPAPVASAPLLVTASPTPVPTLTPVIPTVTPVPPVVIPVIPQVFQHVPQGIFTNPHPNTPTPVRQAAAPIVLDPAGPVVLRPPSTGDAGLMKAIKLPSAW